MLQEEFTEALAVIEPEELTEEQEAWAEYWHHSGRARKHWYTFVNDAEATGWLLAIAAPLLVVSYLIYQGMPTASLLSKLMFALTAATGSLTGFVGVMGLLVSLEEGISYLPLKRAIPELPPHYTEEMGKAAHELRIDVEFQRTRLLEAGKLVERYDEIEANRTRLSSYQLTSGQDADELSVSDELALLE